MAQGTAWLHNLAVAKTYDGHETTLLTCPPSLSTIFLHTRVCPHRIQLGYHRLAGLVTRFVELHVLLVSQPHDPPTLGNENKLSEARSQPHHGVSQVKTFCASVLCVLIHPILVHLALFMIAIPYDSQGQYAAWCDGASRASAQVPAMLSPKNVKRQQTHQHRQREPWPDIDDEYCLCKTESKAV